LWKANQRGRMKTKELILNSFSESDMLRVLLVFDNGQQCSFWIGKDMEHEHLVETLLSTASDIVHKAKIENEE
jgi:hypothetical protein